MLCLKDEAGLPEIGNLSFFICPVLFYSLHNIEKAKPVVRRGRKATGLVETTGLPQESHLGFFVSDN